MKKRLLAFCLMLVCTLTVTAKEMCRPGCGRWSACVDGTQFRSCCSEDGTSGYYYEARECRDPLDPGNWGVLGGREYRNFDGTTIESTFADLFFSPGRFKFGAARITPLFRAGAAQASFDVSRDLATLYEGGGTILNAGGELLIRPCPGCRSVIGAGYGYQTLNDADPFRPSGVPGEVNLEYTSHRVGLRYGYQLNERVVPSIGARWTAANFTTTFEGFDTVDGIDVDREEAVAGVDVRLTRRIRANFDLGYDGHELQPSASFTIRFGRDAKPVRVPIDDGSPGTLTNPIVADDCALLQQQWETLPDQPQAQVDIGCRLYHTSSGPTCYGGCWPGTKCELRIGTMNGKFYSWCQCLGSGPVLPITGPWDLER